MSNQRFLACSNFQINGCKNICGNMYYLYCYKDILGNFIKQMTHFLLEEVI